MIAHFKQGFTEGHTLNYNQPFFIQRNLTELLALFECVHDEVNQDRNVVYYPAG